MLCASKFPSTSTVTAASTTCGDLTTLSFAENWVSLAEAGSLSEIDGALDSDEDLWMARCGLLTASEAQSPWRPRDTTRRSLYQERALREMPDALASSDDESGRQTRVTARSDVSVNGSLLTMTAVQTRASLPPLEREAIEEEDEKLDEEEQERMKLYSAVCRLKMWMGILESIGAEQTPMDDDVLAALNMVGTS